MKFVGVSAPAWTLLGKPKEPLPKPVEEGEVAIVDADMLSKKHLYPRAPTTVIVAPEPKIRRNSPEATQQKEPEEVEKKTEEDVKPQHTRKRHPGQDRFHYQKMQPGPGPGSYQHDLNKKITNSLPNFNFGYKFNSEPEPKEKIPIDELKSGNIQGIYHPLYNHKEFHKGIRINVPTEKKLPKKPQNQNLESKEEVNLLETTKKEFSSDFMKHDSQNLHLKAPKIKKGTFSKAARQPIYGGLAPSANIESFYDTDIYTIAHRAEQIKKAAELKQSGQLGKSASDGKLLKKVAPTQHAETQAPGFSHTDYNFTSKGPAWKMGTSSRPDLNPPPPQLTQKEQERIHKFTERLRNESQSYQAAQEKRYERLLHGTFPKADKMADLSLSPERKAKHNESEELKQQLKLEREAKAEELIAQRRALGNGPAFSFSGKHPLPGSQDREQVPGPGKYDFDHWYRLEYSNGKAAKIGTSQRPPLLNATGSRASEAIVLDDATRAKQIQWEQERQYYAMRDQGPGIKFPKAKRRPMANNTDQDIEVGPGQYKLKSTIPQPQPHELARMVEADKVVL
jgi:hypothetical protein